MLKLNPFDFQFYQLVAMRRGCEFESWDRLAFSTAYAASFVGVKKVKMENYHKFLIDQKTQRGITKDELLGMKKHFD